MDNHLSVSTQFGACSGGPNASVPRWQVDDMEETMSNTGRIIRLNLFNQSHSENIFGQLTLLSLVAGDTGAPWRVVSFHRILLAFSEFT